MGSIAPVVVAEVLGESASRIVASKVSDTARLDAELIVGSVLQLNRAQLRIHDDRAVAATDLARIAALVDRRCHGEPVAYLLERAWFYGLELFVDRRVLVPRPETELLVDLALAHLGDLDAGAERRRASIVVDACTGSGCVAIALAQALGEGVKVIATDISGEASEVAARNVEQQGVRVDLRCGDLLEPVAADELAAVIVANPPYVEHVDVADMEPWVRDHEPHVALLVPADSSVDELYLRLATAAVARLEPGGLLAVEHGRGQRARVVDALTAAGLVDIDVHDDLAGIDRVVTGRRRAAEGGAVGATGRSTRAG